MTVDDIGQDNDSLLCITDQHSHTENVTRAAIGNWYFPNGTRVPDSGMQWEFHGTRGHMMVQMQRRGGLEDGIYRCEIPDTMNVTQTIYIGVYSASTGEWHIYTYICVTVYTCNKREGQHGLFVHVWSVNPTFKSTNLLIYCWSVLLTLATEANCEMKPIKADIKHYFLPLPKQHND